MLGPIIVQVKEGGHGTRNSEYARRNDAFRTVRSSGGGFSEIYKISNYNGQFNDNSVQVDLYTSTGLKKPAFWSCRSQMDQPLALGADAILLLHLRSQPGDPSGSQLGHKFEKRQITHAFAGGALVLIALGGLMSLGWFGRLA